MKPDWEQRRYEIARDLYVTSIVEQVGLPFESMEQSASLACQCADILVEVLRKDESKQEPKKPRTPSKRPLLDRMKDFRTECHTFVGEYPKTMMESFYNYWSEKTASGEKMRWEKEPSWELDKRVARWALNNGITKTEKKKPRQDSDMKEFLKAYERKETNSAK